MSNKKIINDPVHGFITIPYSLIFELIEHPYVQRLRRIKQLGMTDYVYPGAVHTRFHHALGATHLMTEALRVLLSKGVDITEEECEAACVAILLHDIGHGPFSHALENLIIPMSHEHLGYTLMQDLNHQFNGRLGLAIKIFDGTYHKKFLHQLVSSQLDMDRMDYLARDSFYTGVTEGMIGHARLIKMLDVYDNQLVVEEKALHSIKKFLHARHFMYWQVYLHKTVLSTEIMLQRMFVRMKEVYKPQFRHSFGQTLSSILELQQDAAPKKFIEAFVQLDDNDIFYAIKHLKTFDDEMIKILALGLQERRLFKLSLRNSAEECDQIKIGRLKSVMNPNFNQDQLKDLIVSGSEKTTFYSTGEEEIKVLVKSGGPRNLSEFSEMILGSSTKMYYVSYPSEDLIRQYLQYK